MCERVNVCVFVCVCVIGTEVEMNNLKSSEQNMSMGIFYRYARIDVSGQVVPTKSFSYINKFCIDVLDRFIFVIADQ